MTTTLLCIGAISNPTDGQIHRSTDKTERGTRSLIKIPKTVLSALLCPSQNHFPLSPFVAFLTKALPMVGSEERATRLKIKWITRRKCVAGCFHRRSSGSPFSAYSWVNLPPHFFLIQFHASAPSLTPHQGHHSYTTRENCNQSCHCFFGSGILLTKNTEQTEQKYRSGNKKNAYT